MRRLAPTSPAWPRRKVGHIGGMALRPPRDLRLESGASVLDYELLGEKAATLGRLGQRAAQAVARLNAFDLSLIHI